MNFPKNIDICGVDYIRADSINRLESKVKPYSWIYHFNGHTSLHQVCPNDHASWGNVSISKKYRFCPQCGCEIDRECYFDREKKFREMQMKRELVHNYEFSDDEELNLD